MSGVELHAPLPGTFLSITDVPDPVFAEGIVGPGFAISPEATPDMTVVAPICGTIAKIHPHAFVIKGGSCAVLVHLGLDTVTLKGEGFDVLAGEGDAVSAGDALIRWNPVDIVERGLHPICPVVFLEGGDTVTYAVEPGTAIERGQVLTVSHD